MLDQRHPAKAPINRHKYYWKAESSEKSRGMSMIFGAQLERFSSDEKVD